MKAMLVACSMALRMAGAGAIHGEFADALCRRKLPWGEGISSKLTWMGGTSALVGMM